MSSKHFISDPTRLVDSALAALPKLNPSVTLDPENKIVYLSDSHTSDQVNLVSGGGSGHEPSFGALVGSGILTASVAGTIFASPSAEQVRRCILGAAVSGEKGVCVIVMNYTGDVLNFGMAVEKAKARGAKVEMIVVGDDAGVGRKAGGKVGRRGIAGTVLVVKIAGALAKSGASLDEVGKIARLTADNMVSIGASLSHCHVPGRVEDSGEGGVKYGEIEIGMGIHNEAGSEHLSASLPSTIKTMLARMLDPSDSDRAFFCLSASEPHVLLINNLGGVSVLEMSGIATEALSQLESDYNVKPVRILCGTYMTSLNMPGFSLTLLKLADTGLGGGKDMLNLLDAPAEAIGWTAPVTPETWSKQSSSSSTTDPATAKPTAPEEKPQPSGLTLPIASTKETLTCALNRVIAAEPQITHYDTLVGDGDCGIGLKRGAEAILDLLNKILSPSSTDNSETIDAAILVQEIAGVVEMSMDGTSGALYAIFLNALAAGLRSSSSSTSSQTPVTPQTWSAALSSSLASLSKYTPARPGDRTLVDALFPFVEAMKEGDVKAAAQKAKEGAESTKGMRASLGRTVYVGGEGWSEVPDPGAVGVAGFVAGLVG
ncbi:dihydroxyacetone kinase [Aulographum hederae CBS 113979]|uniref:Dihydroxyacetone kinase n=1 Tax=Aulographum hederae CBS 113979 TaxID=1176131 RepID=A0A6G1H1C5_9PEZI|nr:dihydroxyacetone kinase [Aulographum hederae CBS 113979]